LHNTHDKSSAKGAAEKVYCTIHNRLSLKRRKAKAESPGIIDKEFFKKKSVRISESKKFNKKLSDL
jgi:hypothetical protein